MFSEGSCLIKQDSETVKEGIQHWLLVRACTQKVFLSSYKCAQYYRWPVWLAYVGVLVLIMQKSVWEGSRWEMWEKGT